VLVAGAASTTYCGCSGVGALISAHHQATASGRQLRIVASPALRRMLTLTGADAVLDTYPTLTAAGSRTAQVPVHCGLAFTA
jgi:anti-anti-sigma factor